MCERPIKSRERLDYGPTTARQRIASDGGRWSWVQVVDDGHVKLAGVGFGVDADRAVVRGCDECAGGNKSLEIAGTVVVLGRSELAMQAFNLAQALLHGLVGVIADVALLLQPEADVVVEIALPVGRETVPERAAVVLAVVGATVAVKHRPKVKKSGWCWLDRVHS